MFNNNTSYQEAINAPSRRITGNVTIKGQKLSDDISSIDYVSSISGNTLTIGATNASTVDIKFKKLIEGLAERELIKVSFSVQTSSGIIERQIGEFFLTEIKLDRNNKTTTLKAIDKMAFLNDKYSSTLLYPTLGRNIVQEIANSCNLRVNNNLNITNLPSFSKKLEKVTYREMLGYLAQTVGAFVIFNNNGELEFRKLNRTQKQISKGSYLLKGLEVDEVEYRINGISISLNNQEKTILAVGSPLGTQVKLTNPLMTQGWLNSIFSEYSRLRFNPFKLKWRGDPFVEVGDWVSIEIANGSYRAFPILELKLSYSGGLKSTIGANVKGTTTSTTEYKGTVERQIEFINARLGASGNYVYADTVEPTNPKEGDTWFKPNGAFTDLYIYENNQWVLKTSTGNIEGLITKITDSSVSTQNLATAIAKIIELDAARITTGSLSFEQLSSNTVSEIRKGMVSETKFNSFVNDSNGLRQQMSSEIERVVESKKSTLKGQDGKSSYIHKKYTNDVVTGPMTDNSNSIYIGIYTGDKAVAPTNMSEYEWTRIRGYNGVSSYIHRKYSDNSNGDNMDDNSSRKYIGIYTGKSSTPPTTASSYLWSKIKGEDGAQGVPGVRGADGRTTYLHTAYSNSATGDRDFSTTNSTGKEYIGTYSDFEVTDSTDFRKYKWVKIKGENGERGRDGQDGKSYARNYLSGTADEKILTAVNDNFVTQEALKLVDNKNFRDLGFNIGDKVTFIADYEVLPNGTNKKISKLNFEWYDDNRYRFWMNQDFNPTKGTFTRTIIANNDLLDCKRAFLRTDNVNAKIKITNARVIKGDTVQPWSIAQEDLQAHSLTANLRFEGTYINNITNNVRPYLDVFYDGQKVSSGFNAQVKYKGGNRTDWSGFWNVNFDSNGRITNLDWGNREQNGTPLEVIVLVTYKDSNTIANARLDNLPDPTEIKEITKKYKTFESTIDRFNSTIGEVKQQVLANEEKRNLVLGSRMISENDYNKIGGSIDLTLQQAYEGLPYLSLQQNGKTSRVWQGVGFNLSINRINKGETYSIKIPIFISDTIRPDEGAYLEIKNHDTGEILWQSKLDKNTYPIGVWHTHEYTFTASKDMKISKNSFWIYIVKNGFLAFAKPYMCAGSSLPKNYSPAPEDVYLINERVESKILQIKNEINLAVEENIKRATIPTDNLYLSEYGGASDKYFETRENLKANEFYTFVFNANGTSETATGRIYKGINRIGESNFRISINNGLNAFLVKYPSERSKGEGINLDNIPNGVNISDVKIFKGNFLSYFKEDVTKAEIKILKNKIENAVTEGDFGTKLTQNANSLRLAWNNISEYVQFENGGLNIYNGEISEYQLRSRFDQDGNTFYRNGYTVGYIGTVALKDRSNDYGLTFNLEHNATYMAWAYRTKNNDNPDLIWYYTRKSISAYTEANTLNAGCDLNMQNNKLKNTQILNSSFSDSTATSTSLKFTDGQTVTSGWFVLPTSIDDDGNVRGWADKCFLAFRNGILVNYSLP
nr:MAG TPA: tail protein [Caudoviricetes sp.]